MSRRLDVLNVGAMERPAPAMPGACQSGGCGGADDGAGRAEFPAFGEVSVNGVAIAPEAIAQEIQHHPAPDPETAWTDAARALAVRELLLQEARRLAIEADPEEDEAGRVEDEEDALVRALLEEEIAAELPGEEECRRFYEGRAERFRTPDLFEASHILIEPEGSDDAAWATAAERARAIIGEIGDDPAAFAAAARAFSSCPSGKQDGSLGQIRRGDLLPDVQAGIEALADGTIAREPVRSRYGWHVLRLQRRIPGRILPFDVVRGRIADMLEARSWSVSAARYIAGLAARSQVEGIAIGDGAMRGRG